jgi:hypothetical protein
MRLISPGLFSLPTLFFGLVVLCPLQETPRRLETDKATVALITVIFTAFTLMF